MHINIYENSVYRYKNLKEASKAGIIAPFLYLLVVKTNIKVIFPEYKKASMAILVLEFYNNLWGLGTELEKGCRTGPPGYIGWRNRFLGIDS